MPMSREPDNEDRRRPARNEPAPRDVSDELSFHIEELIDEYRAQGMSVENARLAAHRRFGDYHAVEAACAGENAKRARVERWRTLVGALLQDVRFALRQLRANRVVSVVAVATLAIGIGANTAMFSAVNGVLLRPLPYHDADNVYVSNMSYPDFRDVRQRARAFDGLTAWASNLYTLRNADTPEEVMGGVVEPAFFSMLARPVLGRAFDDSDVHTPVAILSDELWRRRYGAERSALGKTIDLSGTTFTIVGVMPAGFEYPDRRYEVWVPLAHAMGRSEQLENRSLRIFRVVGHLAPGVAPETMASEATALSAQLEREQPATNEGVAFTFRPLREALTGDVRPALLVLLGAVGLVLLIACVNVANLLLGVTAARVREMALRRALGAGRGRLIRQLMTESVVLGGLGGVAGVLLAWWLVRLLPRLSLDLPLVSAITIDVRVLAVALFVTLLTAAIFGLGPALQGTRVELAAGLRDGGRTQAGGRRAGWARGMLAACEVALAMVVLVGATLLVQSLVRVLRQDIGFEPERLASMNVGLFYFDAPEQRTVLLEQALERIRAIPGVEAAGGGSGLPPETAQRGTAFDVAGRAPDQAERDGAYWLGITPDYFAALGTRVVSGRAFDPTDGVNANPVAIISEGLARALFPAGDAIGRQIRLQNGATEPVWRTIVGVVRDIRYQGLENPFTSAIYTPFAQAPFLWSYVMVRSSLPLERLAPSLRDAIGAVDARMVPARIVPHAEVVTGLIAQRRLITALIAIFAGLAVLLAAIGIYGVIAYGVAQRRREIGVRLVLGAAPWRVVGGVVGGALRMAGAGLAVGVIAALSLTRLLAGLLYGVEARDPIAFAGGGLLICAVALLASALPAARAARVSPAVILKE